MPGVAGRSGRPRKPLDEHLLTGTYRRDRHGPPLDRDRGNLAVAVIPSSASAAIDRDREARRVLRGLSSASRRLGRSLLDDFEGWSAPELTMLRLMLEALDRAEACRKVIAVDGLMPAGERGDSSGSPEKADSAAGAVNTNGGLGKLHPLLRVERQAMTFAAGALRQLTGGK